MLLGCDGEQIGDVEEEDKVCWLSSWIFYSVLYVYPMLTPLFSLCFIQINLIEKGKYYGHPNPKRGEKDSRQCTWRSSNEPSDGEYTAPLVKVQSSTDGIIEFKSDAFDGQLRGNLIGTCTLFYECVRTPDQFLLFL